MQNDYVVSMEYKTILMEWKPPIIYVIRNVDRDPDIRWRWETESVVARST